MRYEVVGVTISVVLNYVNELSFVPSEAVQYRRTRLARYPQRHEKCRRKAKVLTICS